MKKRRPVRIDFSQCTWEGAQLAHLADFKRLPLSAKLKSLEGLCEFADSLLAKARRRKIRGFGFPRFGLGKKQKSGLKKSRTP
jgi:hypothetical protein